MNETSLKLLMVQKSGKPLGGCIKPLLISINNDGRFYNINWCIISEPSTVGSLSHFLPGFSTSKRWLALGFLKHQQVRSRF